MHDVKALLGPIHGVCQAAAEAILPVYAAHRSGLDAGVEKKADRSPLTAADRAAHDVIVERLGALYPDIPIVSEEGAPRALGDARHWLVDPLDGTKEFLKANGEFTVNIALVERGRPLFGMVLVPVDGRAFAGAPGQGAWLLDGRADTQAPEWQPMRCTPFTLGMTCRAVVSRSHRDERTQAFLNALKARGVELEEASVGSSLKLCQVASGAAHVYPRLAPTMHWDTAAAHAVVEGAGGTVTDIEGGPLRYGHGDLRNPWFIVGAPAPWPWHDVVPAAVVQAAQA